MNFILIFILIISAVVFSFWSFWVIRVNKIYRDFHSYASAGDPINFYIGEEKHRATLLVKGGIYSTIKYEQTHMTILTTDIAPLFTYNYKISIFDC